MNKIKALFMKDVFSIKNSVKNIIITYGVYIFVLLMMRDFFKKLNSLPENILVFVVIVLSVNLGLLFITTFVNSIYKESTVGKEEVYFAYGYSIFEVCFGKAILFSLLSMIIPLIVILLFFPTILTNMFFIINILFIIPLLFLIISYLIIFFTWFTRLGIAVYFTIFFGVFIFLYKGFSKIIKIKFNPTFITLLLSEILILFVLGFIGWIFTKSTRKEKIIEKLS